jgi:hypothetical protein
LIVGDLSKINEKNKRAMSFEEVANSFTGFSYIEVDISTGFNLDQL